MKRGDYIGMTVRLAKDKTIPIELLPGCQMLEVEYEGGAPFVVEHDFRDGKEGEIHVGFPDGRWAALTSGQFAELFGGEALARLDAIPYDE
jgi:hypothetical protein